MNISLLSGAFRRRVATPKTLCLIGSVARSPRLATGD
jgi:hypothetical protein